MGVSRQRNPLRSASKTRGRASLNTNPDTNMSRNIAHPRPARKPWRVTALAALALAGIAAAPQAIAAPTDGQKFKNWAARCEQVPTGEGEQTTEQCYIFQTLAHKETQKALLNVAVGYVAESGKPAAILTLPLGVFLPPGIAIKVDEGEPSRLPIQLCTQEGCRGVLELTDDVVNRLKAGSEAKIAFFDARRREVVVPISLHGFTAGFNSLKYASLAGENQSHHRARVPLARYCAQVLQRAGVAAAVDDDVLAGDVARLPAAQERAQLAELGRIAEPLRGDRALAASRTPRRRQRRTSRTRT